MKRSRRIETTLIHGGEIRPRVGGAITLPVFQSLTFELSGEDNYHDVRYVRLSNTPNHVVLHRKLALLEAAEAAIVAGSGMAAISSTLLTLLSQGDHLLAHRCLYGGSHSFITKDVPTFGMECTFLDADEPGAWAAALRPTTRDFYVETMTNPLLEVVDLPEVVAF